MLPNKIHQPEKFESEVVELRKRFVDKSRPDYVFQPSYHKRIPADGLSHYMEGIWQQVLANKDLDLPTQQELLAQFRCDELAAGVIEVFNASAKVMRRPIESGKVIPGLGKHMAEWLHTALSEHATVAPLTLQPRSMRPHRATILVSTLASVRTLLPTSTPHSPLSTLES